MNRKALIMICCILLAAGCATGKPAPTQETPMITCPLPSGYQMAPAIATAEKTLRDCPGKLDEVFEALLDIARHSPSPENGMLIQDMLKEMIKQNRISETYSKALYQKYFSTSFVSVPDVKVYRLADDIDTLKRNLRTELQLKRIGMIECCNDRDAYQSSEAEFIRIMDFMENLILNEEYLKAERR